MHIDIMLKDAEADIYRLRYAAENDSDFPEPDDEVKLQRIIDNLELVLKRMKNKIDRV